MTNFDLALLRQEKVLADIRENNYETLETCSQALHFATSQDLTIEHYDRLKRLFYLSDGEPYSAFVIHRYAHENPLQETL